MKKVIELYKDNSDELIQIVEVTCNDVTTYIVEQLADEDEIVSVEFITLPDARIYFAYRVTQYIACFAGIDATELSLDDMLAGMKVASKIDSND